MEKYACYLHRILAAILTIFMLVPILPVKALSADTSRELTLMVYMTGSDLESENGLASRDVREMMRAHNDPENVTVLVMIGGSKEWHGQFPSDRSAIYELVDGEAIEVWTNELMNMGDPATLTTLINYGYYNYPAKDYALILWNHGSGPLGGLCFDEVHSSQGINDSLDLIELKSALNNSACADEPLEWIGFDACLMGSVETAFICAPFATYMIASQEVEPGTGWDYSFLSDIAYDPSGAVTGIRIVDAYYESFNGMHDQLFVTLSCIDLRKIKDVEIAMDDVFGRLHNTLSTNSFSTMSNLRRDTKAIGRSSTGSEYDLIDLYHLSQLYSNQLSGSTVELISAIDSAIIYNRSNIDNLNGLSVYFPYYNKDYYEYIWHDKFNSIGFSKGYSRYVNGYANIWLSGSLSNWHGMQTFISERNEHVSDTLFTMELSDDQVSNFSSAQLYVMSYDKALDLYSFVYSTDAVVLDGNTLSATYNNTALYVLDSDGNPISGSLEYRIVEDSYLLRAVLCQGKDMFAGDTLPVYLQLKPIQDTAELEVIGIIDLSDDAQLTTGKQSITLDPEIWKSIYIANYPVYLTHDENGDVLPFPEWEDSSWVFADLFSNEDEWHIKFVEENYITHDFATMFVVSDTQGNKYGSELTFIENKNIEPLSIEPCTLVDNEQVTAKLTGANLSFAGYDPCLMLNVEITNNTDRQMSIYVDSFIAGDTAMEYSQNITDDMQPGETINTTIMLYTYKLQEYNMTSMPSLNFKLHLFDSELRETVYEQQLTIDQPIDISPLFNEIDVLAVPESIPDESELTVDLFEVSIEEDGTLSCWLRYTNNTDTDIDTYIDTAIINGCFVSGVINHSVWAPAGKTAYRKISFVPESPVYDIYYYSIPPLDSPLDYWGIEVINDICLRAYDEDYNYIYVDVNMPGPISISNSSHVVHADTDLYSDENIHIIRRGKVYWEDDYLNVMLVVENTSDHDAVLTLSEGYVGENAVNVRSSTDMSNNMHNYFPNTTLPAGTSFRYLVGLETAELTANTNADVLNFELNCVIEGNNISIPVTVDIPSDITQGNPMSE